MNRSSNVSITLANTPDSQAIVAAIQEDNADTRVVRFPSMVKIDCPNRLVINRETVAGKLGRDWDVQEIHLNMISLSGSIDEDDDYLVIAWN